MKQVWVTVTGSQRYGDGEEQKLELQTSGRYYEKNGVHYVVYEESQISGMEGTTTALKLYPDHIVLSRSGEVEQKLDFYLHRKTSGQYLTAFGRMRIDVYTKTLEINLLADGNSGFVMIHYDLEIDGQWHSMNRLTVAIREEKQDGY